MLLCKCNATKRIGRARTSECSTEFKRLLSVILFDCAHRNRAKLYQGCETKKEIYDLEMFLHDILEGQRTAYRGIEKRYWYIKQVGAELTWLALPHGC
jgi:hypothetical protein